jgi:hypothetical protein
MIELEMVLVTWKDAELKPGGWTPLDEVDMHLSIMRTVGFLLGETEDAIGLCSDLDAETDDTLVHSVALIPKGMVVSIERLGVIALPRLASA